MTSTRVAHEDFSDLNIMTAIGWARIDGVAVVNATANRVTLNDLDTHVDKFGVCKTMAKQCFRTGYFR